MSGNRKDFRWCVRCRKWIMAFPLGIGQTCGDCWVKLSERDKHRAEAKATIEYLERDYAKGAI